MLSPKHLQDMLKALDSFGDGLIPTAPVLEFLQQEAELVHPSGGRNVEQVHSSQFLTSLVALFDEMAVSHRPTEAPSTSLLPRPKSIGTV